MDVAAIFADETEGGGVGPIEVEEGGKTRVQLGFAAMEFVVGADLTFEVNAVDFVCLRFFCSEQTHGRRLHCE